jgi:hypothetical protein
MWRSRGKRWLIENNAKSNDEANHASLKFYVLSASDIKFSFMSEHYKSVCRRDNRAVNNQQRTTHKPQGFNLVTVPLDINSCRKVADKQAV